MSKDGKIEVPETDLQKIMKVVNSLSEGNIQVIRLEANQENINKKLEQEIKDRKKDTGDVKDNYITRFDKVDNLFDTVFEKIDKIIDQGVQSKKEQVKRMWAIISVFLGCSAFLFISMIWEKAILPLFK